MSLRNARRWLTDRGRTAAMAAAPRLSPRAWNTVERWLARLGPRVPVLARQVCDNMRSAGVYSDAAARAYFDQVALHLSNAGRVFASPRSGQSVADLANAQVSVDDSIDHLRQALAAGHGAVVAAPHVCNYLLTLVRLNREVPLRIYLRYSSDPRKRRLKQAWCEAAGLNAIQEPASAADPTSRAAALVELLREGHAVVMTPDIAQRADRGVPVRLFDREVYLPTGPPLIAMLAEVPLVPVFGRVEGLHHTITCHEPITVEPVARAEGGRRAAMSRAMQRWAEGFEAFVRSYPQAWFLWGDGRWARVFRGDPKYTRDLDSAESNHTARNPTSQAAVSRDADSAAVHDADSAAGCTADPDASRDADSDASPPRTADAGAEGGA